MSFLFIFSSVLPIPAPSIMSRHPELAFLDWLTNSILVCVFVSFGVIWFCRRATSNMALVPGARQNFFEGIAESVYEMVEGIVGKHMVARTFPFLATLFLFILASNWFALVPGVGSIGFGEKAADGFPLALSRVDVPLLRPTTADLNMTFAMAALFMVLWLWWSLREVGPKNFLGHMFGVKGGLSGIAPIVLFFFVGLIEVVSIAFRPVSLSLRLFGNVYAGENLLTTMITLGKQLNLPDWVAAIMSVTIPIPFYFLELLIGFLQATVFMLLCAVYIQLSTSHDEEEAH